MPEYLAPGVFIEEVPSLLKAIEGVSTSTAAFVGPAGRGTVPGYPWPGSAQIGLPFKPNKGFTMTPDPAPILVTSFAEFQRTFGPPLAIPVPGDADWGYLGHAVRAFFDNGGKRVYIARIVVGTGANPATPGVLRVAQGVAYRLARSTQANADRIYLTSTRGLNVGDTITFVRRSDGSDPLSTLQPATLDATGVSEPFALKDGDRITITPTAPGAPVTITVTGKPMSVQTAAPTPPNFQLADRATLQIRVGPASEPVQTITFDSADLVTPITPLPGDATPDQVQEVISRYARGLRCYLDAAKNVVLETDVLGTAARLEVVGGTAVAALGLTVGLGTQAAGSNVPDLGYTRIADLQALPAVSGSLDIVLTDDGTHHLRVATRAAGTTATLTLTEVPPGSGALARLGFTGALTAAGKGAAAPVIKIKSYDLPGNSIELDTALSPGLDAGDIYVLGPPATQRPAAGAGPQFYARSPGAWSAGLSVSIANADRSPTPIVAVNTALGKIRVQSVASLYVGAVVEVDHNGTRRSIHQVTEVNAPLREITVSLPLPSPAIVTGWVRTLEVDITIGDDTGAMPSETYTGLSWNQDPQFADLRRHYAWQINARSRLVWVQPPGVGAPTALSGSEGPLLTAQPATLDGFAARLALTGTLGSDGAPPTDAQYLGDDLGPGQRSGIESLKDLRDARIIAAPGQTSQAVQVALIAQCELLRYRFAILDGEQEPQALSLTSILTHRSLYDSSFAAYYQPWVTVALDGHNRQLPPSGFLAGVYARVDNSRGVWKAPANETVQDAIGLKIDFTTGEQEVLNPAGVDLIRRFDLGGIRVWGARTLASDPDVRYINVRRTLIFLEASIDQGTQWVVFEPNTPETWDRLTNSIRAFLLTQWRAGALFGDAPGQAFFVRCDETTMTADDILNGRLICQIGVAIVRPAEFVIFRIQQITNFGAQS